MRKVTVRNGVVEPDLSGKEDCIIIPPPIVNTDVMFIYIGMYGKIKLSIKKMERHNMNTSKRIMGIVFAVLSAMAFGFIPLVAKMAYKEGIGVNTLLFLRFGLGAGILWAYIIIKKIEYKTTYSHSQHILFISVFGYVMTTTAYFYAFRLIPSSLTTIITFLFPVIVVAYEMVKQKKVQGNKIVCLLLTMIGLWLIVGIWDSDVKLDPTGVALALLSAVAYAIFCIGAGEKRTTEMNSVALSAYIMRNCALCYMSLCLVFKEPLLPPTIGAWGWILVLAVACGIMPILLLALAIKFIGSGTASIAGAFEPLASCILGVAFLGENMTVSAVIGGLLIVGAVLGLEITDRKKRKVIERGYEYEREV